MSQASAGKRIRGAGSSQPIRTAAGHTLYVQLTTALAATKPLSNWKHREWEQLCVQYNAAAHQQAQAHADGLTNPLPWNQLIRITPPTELFRCSTSLGRSGQVTCCSRCSGHVSHMRQHSPSPASPMVTACPPAVLSSATVPARRIRAARSSSAAPIHCPGGQYPHQHSYGLDSDDDCSLFCRSCCCPCKFHARHSPLPHRCSSCCSKQASICWLKADWTLWACLDWEAKASIMGRAGGCV